MVYLRPSQPRAAHEAGAADAAIAAIAPALCGKAY